MERTLSDRIETYDSEDKTAEQFFNNHPSDLREVVMDNERVINAIQEFGTLRWNKAIEEVVNKIEKGVPPGRLISELNKLKHP